jgi:hypothetical protein
MEAATGTNDIVLTSTGWVHRVHFASRKDALIMDLVDGSTNSPVHHRRWRNHSGLDQRRIEPRWWLVRPGI